MSNVLKAEGMNKCIGCFSCMLTCAVVNNQNHSISKSAIKVRTRGGLRSNYVAVLCLGCKTDIPCEQACPSGALEPRKGGGVLLNKDKCTGCKKCMNACIVGAIGFDIEKNTPIVCKHCGVCARFCPHECLKLEEVE